jgi:hypothetical protein
MTQQHESPYDGTFKGKPLTQTRKPSGRVRGALTPNSLLHPEPLPIDWDLLRRAEGVYLGLLELSYLWQSAGDRA